MRSLLAALSLTASLAFAASAQAPYTVADVLIDATADNALEAQTNALRQGQSLAAQRLVERLTLVEDRTETGLDLQPYLNEEGELVTENALTDGVVAEMISGLEIYDEQRSATRYLARLVVSFDSRAVERIFNNYGVPFVESQSRPTLVLPVFESGQGFVLWEENPWQAAFTEQDFSHALTPMFVPDDELSQSVVSARSALSLDEEGLRQLASINSVSRIAVLRAQERDGVRRFGGYLVNLENAEEMQVETWGPQTVFGGWSDAAASFVADREDVWKRQSVVRDGETTELRVTVLYGGLNEWQRLQGVVTGASLVTDARLDALSRDGALMTVNYRGQQAQLESELAERGAALEEHPGIGWIVRTSY